jgi:hypothetical protein
LPKDKTTDGAVATIVGSGEPTVRDAPRSVRTEGVGRKWERAPVVSTARTFAQTLREVAGSRRPIETDGRAAKASERPPRMAVAAGQRLLA